MKTISENDKNKFKLLIFSVMSLPSYYTFNSLFEVTNPGTQRFLRHFSPFTLKRCLQSINTWMSSRTDIFLNEIQAMQENTSPYSRILENSVVTSSDFFWRRGMVLRLA